MLNLCWSIKKIFLSVLVVFGKYFVFTKIVKKNFKKISKKLYCPVLATQSRVEPVACPNCESIIKIFRDSLAVKCFSLEKDLEYFSKFLDFHAFCNSGWRLVCRWKVQSRGVHRDFRSSVRDSFASGTSSHEKHLKKIFENFLSSVLVAGPGDLHATWFSREKRVFCTN